jgi:hypothetical protein
MPSTPEIRLEAIISNHNAEQQIASLDLAQALNLSLDQNSLSHGSAVRQTLNSEIVSQLAGEKTRTSQTKHTANTPSPNDHKQKPLNLPATSNKKRLHQLTEQPFRATKFIE